MSILNATNISKTFITQTGQKLSVLDNMSLEINGPGTTIIVGQSGSGKSTLIHCLGGFLTPTTGQVYLSGHSIYEVSDSQKSALIRSHIGFVFQSFHLIPSLTVGDNLALPLAFEDTRTRLGIVTKEDSAARIHQVLHQLGVTDKVNEYPTQLSGGQKQRVAIARAIIHNPKLIICDEPTGNLDDDNAMIVRECLEKIATTNAVLIVTHDSRLIGDSKINYDLSKNL
jgi:ABC-type lipoprotein export system ATPase subunit